MKKQFRTAMLSTACLLVVAVMSLTGVTYAWFTYGTQAEVTGMQMNVATADGGVEVSTTQDGVYASAMTLDPKLDQVKPVSTADAVEFFNVELNPANTSQIKAIEGSTDNVIIQTLWLRNTGTEKVTVNLAGTTITSAENATTKGTSDIVKAARMAVLDADNNIIGAIYSPQMNEAAYNAIQATTEEYFAMYGSHATGTTSITTGSLDNIVIELPGMTDATTYNPVQITVVIWVEGQDSDAVNQNANGAFNIELVFAKVQ